MNSAVVRITIIGLLLMFVLAPFAGLAPLLLFVLGFGICWAGWSIVQAFANPELKKDS